MWANNETGVLFPVEQISETCRSRGVLYQCDAVQAAGKVPIDVRKVPIEVRKVRADYLSPTRHKFHAAKGIGALYVRRKGPLSSLIYGSHQERNRRGGTESVPLIARSSLATRNSQPDLAAAGRGGGGRLWIRPRCAAGAYMRVPNCACN
jgi:cysteine desulfurase